MRTGRSAGRWALALTALLLVGAVAAGVGATVPTGRALVVSDVDTGDPLFSVPVDDGDRVVLAYDHSVEKTPVRDVYAVRGTSLDNVEMRFQSYGWGLPARENVTLEEGWFVFDPDREYEEIVVQPHPAASHRLVAGGVTYDLVERGDGGAVRLAVEHRTVLERLQ
jgi:hypothetical protein